MLTLICIIIKVTISCVALKTIPCNGLLETIVMGAIIYSLLSFYIWLFKSGGITICFDGIIALAFSICLWLLIPFFMICGLEWLLSLFLPEAVAIGALNGIIIIALLGFIARDVYCVLSSFGVIGRKQSVEAAEQEESCTPAEYDGSRPALEREVARRLCGSTALGAISQKSENT